MGAERAVRDPGTWPERDGRPRILIETADASLRDDLASALVSQGDDVLDCAGPQPDDGHLCPAVEGGRCPGAAHADVVVCDFDPSDPHSRGLPAAVLRELRAGASVIVLVGSAEAERWRDALEGCRLLHPPHSIDDVVIEVRAALADLAELPAPRRLRTHGLEWARSGGH